MPPCGWGIPSRSTRPAKRVRSSARSMVSRDRPGRSTPSATRALARFRGVWPPNWTSAGSGASPARVSAWMTSSTLSASSGSKYSREEASKSVDTVSGLELTMTASQPIPAERVGGLDGAVVELDALADAHGARADDQRGGPRDRRRLGRRAGRGIGRIEIGRLGGELGGAGIDHREARAAGRWPPARSNTARWARPVSVAMSRSPNEARLADTSVPSVTPLPSSVIWWARSTRRSISARNQGATPVTWCSSAAWTPRRSSARRRHSRESDGARNSLSSCDRATMRPPGEAPDSAARSSSQLGPRPGSRRPPAPGHAAPC